MEYTVQEVSAVNILLLMRQKAYSQGDKSITLKDMETIDNCSWEELVRKNRQKFGQLRLARKP